MVFTSTNPPSGYYVYAYIRASDSTPYYIGKGLGRRAWKKHKGVSIPNDKTKIIIIEYNLQEKVAHLYEIALIWWYGRKDNSSGILLNKTSGGDGSSGTVRTEETRRKLCEANIGKKLSEEHRAKISASHKGKIISEETRAKIRAISSNRSAETRAKIGAAGKGRKHSAETRAKMTATKKARKASTQADK
jgi:hypothetical protein